MIPGRSNTAREGLRFIVAGAFNTAFGIADTFLWTWLLVHVVPSRPAIMTAAATLVSTVINITVSFLSYKWFVFRSTGNYLGEYSRSMLVYLPSLLFSMATVAPLTVLLALRLPKSQWAPYIAQACIVALAVVPQFMGHKWFTFRRRR